MKIAVLGSTRYESNKIAELREQLEHLGHVARVPVFDGPAKNELEVCELNRSLIEWADKVYMIWDGNSTGAIFDFGMLFALRKPFKLYYLNPRTMSNVMKLYQVECDLERQGG